MMKQFINNEDLEMSKEPTSAKLLVIEIINHEINRTYQNAHIKWQNKNAQTALK